MGATSAEAPHTAAVIHSTVSKLGS